MRSKPVSRRKGFTLIELLVVIAIIALLMGILMPALQRVKKTAKAAVCQSSLHQWTLIWSMFTQDNDGHFHMGAGGESQTSTERWPVVLQANYQNLDMRLCPMAEKPQSDGALNPNAAWGKFNDGTYGSYGLNEWVCNRPVTTIGGESENYWRNIYSVKGVNRIPVFIDCFWYDVWPHDVDQPPTTDGSTVGLSGSNEMRRVCLNRHSFAVNSAFLDWSVRKVDLKELWTFKWHRNYDTAGPWTIAGGVQREDWPEWMRDLKDY